MNSKICPKCSTILHPITDSEIQSQSGGSSIKIALEMLNTPNTVTLDQIDFIGYSNPFYLALETLRLVGRARMTLMSYHRFHFCIYYQNCLD